MKRAKDWRVCPRCGNESYRYPSEAGDDWCVECWSIRTLNAEIAAMKARVLAAAERLEEMAKEATDGQ